MPDTTMTFNDEIGVNENGSVENVGGTVDNIGGTVDNSERPRFNFSFLTKETGDGEIESYINHPLNFKSSMGLAQILRGVSGLVGTSLKYALLDIIFGFFRLQRETNANVGTNDNQGVSGFNRGFRVQE